MNPPVKTRPDRYSRREQAEAYHASTNAAGRPTLSQRLELAAVARALAAARGGASVLDVPCGTGRIDGLLRERFETVVGLDSSEPMLWVYRDGAPGRAGCCGDIFGLPFDDGAFDWTVCHRYIHHLMSHEERVRALTSLARVSRLGVIFYAWVDTPLARRRSSMRASATPDAVARSIAEAGLTLDRAFRPGGPFSVKRIMVCARR